MPARAVRDHLRGLVMGKKVGIRRIIDDRYGRSVAELFLGTMNIPKEMVVVGHADFLRRYAKQYRWTDGEH